MFTYWFKYGADKKNLKLTEKVTKLGLVLKSLLPGIKYITLFLETPQSWILNTELLAKWCTLIESCMSD